MSGLLERTRQYIGHNSSSAGEDELVFDPKSGISEQDQKDIRAEIEQVIQDNRISVDPSNLKVRAQKKGALFPLLVNLFALLLLVGGGAGFFVLFQRGESGLRDETVALASAEATIIEELKRESEAQLLEKNREISQIQGRLEEIDRERQNLQVDMDARVAAREAELRRTLEGELAAERERLRGQGISETDITLRVQELEARRTETYQQELSTFRRQAEAQRQQAEANLAALRQEYQRDLEQADQERARVLADAQSRETALREQLDQRTRALEEETQAARRELSRIAEERSTEELAVRQLLGLYDQVRGHIEAGRFEQALGSLAVIREYLSDPGIAALPGMLERRSIEFFVVDTISGFVRSELSKREVDTSSLIAAANVVGELKNRVLQADSLYSQGQVDRAESLYREALAMIPEVSRTHQYFLTRAREAEAARVVQLREHLRRAERSFAGGDYEATLGHYTRALEFLPEERTAVERLIVQVRQSGFQLGLLGLRREQSTAAAASLARADRLLGDGQHDAAIAGYLELIRRFPTSEQVAAAAEGINRAVEARGVLSGTDAAALRQELAARDEEIQSLGRQLGRLQEELDARVALIASLQSEKSSLEADIAALREEILDFQARLESQRLARDEQAAVPEQPAAEDAVPRDEVPSDRLEELLSRIAALEALEARYDRLVDGYRNYVSQETSLLAGRGSAALIDSKVHLNAFLAATDETFPGLWVRIKRYDEAFERAGRAGAAQEISYILSELSGLRDAEARARYLEQEARRYAEDPLMLSFLEELEALPVPGVSAEQVQTAGFNRYLDLLAASGRLDTSRMSLLDELSLRSTPESRELFLESELARHRGNETVTRLIEDLLALLRRE